MREIVELKARINQLFEEALARGPSGEASTGEWSPRVDVYELPDRLILRADVPGVASDDLDVRVEAGHLILRGARRQPVDVDPSALHRLERPFGSFVRRWALPDGLDPEAVRATVQNGVLEVILGKRETTAVHRVRVEAG